MCEARDCLHLVPLWNNFQVMETIYTYFNVHETLLLPLFINDKPLLQFVLHWKQEVAENFNVHENTSPSLPSLAVCFTDVSCQFNWGCNPKLSLKAKTAQQCSPHDHYFTIFVIVRISLRAFDTKLHVLHLKVYLNEKGGHINSCFHQPIQIYLCFFRIKLWHVIFSLYTYFFTIWLFSIAI